MSTIAAGGAIVVGEGRWWGSGSCGYVNLGDVAAGATFVAWGSIGWVSGAGYALENAGGGASRLTITEDGTDVTVHADSCSYWGFTIHEVMSAFDVGNCQST